VADRRGQTITEVVDRALELAGVKSRDPLGAHDPVGGRHGI